MLSLVTQKGVAEHKLRKYTNERTSIFIVGKSWSFCSPRVAGSRRWYAGKSLHHDSLYSVWSTREFRVHRRSFLNTVFNLLLH